MTDTAATLYHDGFIQVGVHGKGGGVNTEHLIEELKAQMFTVFETDTHVIYGRLKR